MCKKSKSSHADMFASIIDCLLGSVLPKAKAAESGRELND